MLRANFITFKDVACIYTAVFKVVPLRIIKDGGAMQQQLAQDAASVQHDLDERKTRL